MEARRLEWAGREALGAAILLAPPKPQAKTLIGGSGVLGTSAALAALGADVTLLDTDLDGLRLARARSASAPGRIEAILGGGEQHLPFEDGSFDRIVLPDAPGGLPRAHHESPAEAWLRWLHEAARVLTPNGCLIALATNRFAYKRFGGVHGSYLRPSASGVLHQLSGAAGDRTARGYKKSLRAAGFARVVGYSPYVSHLDYSMLVNLNTRMPPHLEVGRRERANLPKWWGFRAGLFEAFTPSFAWVAGRSARPEPSALERAAARALERVFNVREEPVIERVLATRGNAVIAWVRARGHDSSRELLLRWPLCSKEQRLGAAHLAMAESIHRKEPSIPVPKSYGELEIEGCRVYLEEWLPGENSSQQTGEVILRERTLRDLAQHLARLGDQPTLLSGSELEEVVFARGRRVAARLRDAEMASRVERLSRRVGAMLRDHAVPLVTSHGDLRAKHVLVDSKGAVTGLLDWGTAREKNLPLFDLLHFILHDRKQELHDPLDAAAIRALHPRSFRPHEEAALSEYCARTGVDAHVRRACELWYPIEVATTAYDHWDFDRPRWVESNFGSLLQLTDSQPLRS